MRAMKAEVDAFNVHLREKAMATGEQKQTEGKRAVPEKGVSQ